MNEIRTREAMARQLRAACDASTIGRVGFDSPLTFAAALLTMFGSAADAIEAIHKLPPFEARVTVEGYLRDFAAEEMADTERPRAANAG